MREEERTHGNNLGRSIVGRTARGLEHPVDGLESSHSKVRDLDVLVGIEEEVLGPEGAGEGVVSKRSGQSTTRCKHVNEGKEGERLT
jgi:hypothetical protein